MVNYNVNVPKSDASVIDDVVKAIEESNDTFAGSRVGSVGKSGKSHLFLSKYVFN